MIKDTEGTGIWQNLNFRKLWFSQSVSVFGSQVTRFALPLTAVLTLQATSTQMGILGFVQYLPFLLIGLFVGVWVDRLPQRPILIVADLGRALLLASIPIAAFFHVLNIEYLYVISFSVGIFTVLFDLAYYSFLPSLVERKQLLEGNSKFEISRSFAKIVAPVIGTALVEFFIPPMAIALDAISFLVSALFLSLISTPEEMPTKDSHSQGILKEISEGFQIVLEDPLLRAIAGYTGTKMFFWNMIFSVYMIYLVRDLSINATALGLILGITACGTLIGALLVEQITRLFKLGLTILVSTLILGFAFLLIPLASGPPIVTVPILAVAGFLTGMTDVIWDINQLSIRQSIVPTRLLGRVTANMRFIGWGSMPIGSLLGGALGEVMGMRVTLLLGSLGVILAFLWVFFSPICIFSNTPTLIELE